MTKELRPILKDVLYQELEDIQDRLDLLEPKVRIELLIKLLTQHFPEDFSQLIHI
jgi:hypothetical protein